MRVHTSRLYTRLPGGQADSTGTSLRMDAYSWYAGEARYPVFESLCTTLQHAGRDTVLYATSFYYPPDEQRRQLANDVEDYRTSSTTSSGGSRSPSGETRYFLNIFSAEA